MTSISIADVQRFRAVVKQRLGLLFDDSKLAYLGEVLQRRVEGFEGTGAQYLGLLESREPLHKEIQVLAQDLVVSETYFFRNIEQFHALREVVIPRRLSARSQTRKLSLLSAGCASGEEAYSLAMVSRESLCEPGWQVSVRAIDINPSSLAKAQAGRYSIWSLRETPTEVQHRWFRPAGREFLLDPEVRSVVRFEERNLVQDDGDVWQAGTYDVVFCRNVLMYFAPEQAQSIVQRITRSLAPGGYLFLGHAETLRGLSQDFHLRHTHETFYYQRKDALEAEGAVTAARPSVRPEVNGVLNDLSWTTTWIETVQRSSSKIQSLAATQPAAASGESVASRGARPELGLALELLKEERFSEALELLQALPTRFARDPDALLMRAVLLTHSGQLEISEKSCRELLDVDDFNAGAHYLLALCREGAGDRGGALEHDQAATYLDPSFAMPRLHLGLMARRSGDQQTAHHELGQALTLLQREEVSRIIFFGGGFSREALVALCRAELIATGVKA